MELLKKIKAFAKTQPDQIAIKNMNCEDKILTYQQLDTFSDALSVYIQCNIPDDKTPIIVYGHKNPYMVVAFLACVKSGHPYCPVEDSDGLERVETLMEIIQPHIVLAIEPFMYELKHETEKVLELKKIKEICNHCTSEELPKRNREEEEGFHILFTSGSTGQPKGVEITTQNMDGFLSWITSMVKESIHDIQRDKLVFLNTVPFAFDVSAMDLYVALYMGGTSYITDRFIQSNFKQMLQVLEDSKAIIWVSTPAMAEWCLMSRKFSSSLMPHLEMFLLAGEVLTNAVVGKLIERFPGSKIVNAYGPTEATVVVTAQEITAQMVSCDAPLPLGRPQSGCRIEIWKEDGTLAKPGETGEIVIKGVQVARRYLNQTELTQKAFVLYTENGKQCRGYKTGDLGYLDADGVLHFVGRADTQIQLYGYRIELGDIEQNLMQLDFVSTAVVVPKLTKEKKVKYLIAYILLESEWKKGETEEQKLEGLRDGAGKLLPDHMIPKKFIFVDEFPRNRNGKIDRKKLQSLV